MLEHYMEKDLFRQIVICEHFYKYGQISIEKMADLLAVFPKTIENDISKLEVNLAEMITHHYKKKQHHSLEFNDNYSLYELKKPIYRQSVFLKICRKVAANDCDYLEVVDTYFVSVSKAYSLINRTYTCFEAHRLPCPNRTFEGTEIEWRLLQLNILTRLGEAPEGELPETFTTAVERFIRAIEAYFQVIHYTEEERTFLTYGIYLAYLQQDAPPIEFAANYYEIMEQTFFAQILRKHWDSSELKQYLPESEFWFVHLLFASCLTTFNKIIANIEGIEEIRRTLLTNHPVLSKAAADLSQYLNVQLIGDIAFEQAYLQLLQTCWANYQLLLPQQIHLVKPELKDFAEAIYQIFQHAGDQAQPPTYYDPNLINRFVNDYARLYYQKKQEIHILIVTDSPVKYKIYQDYLKKSWLQIVLEPIYFINLKNALQRASTHSVILCEESFFSLKLTADYIQPILPITVAKLNQPTFNQEFYKLVEELTNRK